MPDQAIGLTLARNIVQMHGGDISLESADDPLPDEVASGAEVVRVVGAMAGG